jgi:H+-transporting ATPase
MNSKTPDKRTDSLLSHDFSKITTDESLRILNVSEKNGLSEQEAEAREKEFGFNEVPEKTESAFLRIGRKFWGLTAWMLEITMIVSFFLHRYFDFYIILTLLLINAIIGFTQEQRAAKAVEALRRRLLVYTRVLREKRWRTVASRELVPGDIIRVRAGDFIPADTKVIEGSVAIDQSALTGESLSVEKKRDGVLYSGSIAVRGEATVAVIHTGVNTYFGKTTELLQKARPRLHMEEVTSKVVSRLLMIVISLIVIVFAVTYFRGANLVEFLPLALLLIVFAVPVALPAMFTVSMAVGSLELVRQGVLVTRLSASEDAATMDTLCADKTGTITANKLSVTKVVSFGDFSETDVIRYGALASKKANQDPIDLAFLTQADTLGVTLSEYVRKKFTPFDPSTRRTEAEVSNDGHDFEVTKGAVDVITKLSGISLKEYSNLQSNIDDFASRGYRTLAVAVCDDEKGFKLCGLAALYDAPRGDSKKLIEDLTTLGISVKILTGDALPIAKEIAAQVGLAGEIANAPDLKNYLAVNKAAALEHIENSAGFAGIYPEDKYIIVKSLQENGHIVAMTGDGVNDAPALHQAEVGIAVRSSTDVAKSAASAVLTGEGLANIVSLIKTGRIIYQRIFTWVLNKIVRTFQVAVFIVAAYLLTGYYVVSPIDIIMLLFLVDFVTISLSTDKVRWSKNPDKWNIAGIVKVSAVLGTLTVVELLGLLFIGINFLGLAQNISVMNTFFLASIFYMGMFTVLIVRERRHFWNSMPSKTLLFAIILDMIVMGAISLNGLPQIEPVNYTDFVVLFLYTMIVTLLINDPVKVRIISLTGLR